MEKPLRAGEDITEATHIPTAPTDSDGRTVLTIEGRHRGAMFGAIAALAGAIGPMPHRRVFMGSSSEDVAMPKLRSASKYLPHQGAREQARRLRQLAKAEGR
jgi:hypothetical protein